MTQSDTGTTLVKLRKMIESMQREEMRQIQSTHSDALAQIVSIANASAQLGDLFRKLGDTIDSVTKQNNVKEANTNQDKKSEDKSEVFVKKEGQTIAQINSEAYIYCAWKERKKDRKYITLEEVYPELENLQVYKNTIVDEILTLDDNKLIEKRKCNERMYFIDGKFVQLEKISELEKKYKKNITTDTKNLLIGRWASPIVCNAVTNRKGGTYISINNNNEIILQNFDSTTSLLTNETTIKRLEKFSIDGKNFIKISGLFSDSKNKNFEDERIWDISNISNNKIFGIDRKINNQQTVKDGVDLSSGQKISTFEKCNAESNLTINNQELKLDNSQSQIKKNLFGIKGIELGGSVPVGFNCRSDKFFETTKQKLCTGEITILEVPYSVNIVVINDKIEWVGLFDNIFENEMSISDGRNKPNLNLWQRKQRIGKLTTIEDFDIYMNDLIKNIIERLGDQKYKPKIDKKEINSIELTSATNLRGMIDVSNTIKELEVKLASSKDKKLYGKDIELYESSKGVENLWNLYLNALNSQCKLCKSMRYKFSWDMGDYLIEVVTSVPATKEDPFPFYSSIIMFNTKDAIINIEKLNAINKKLEDEELKKITDFNKKTDLIKNEIRKKDF